MRYQVNNNIVFHCYNRIMKQNQMIRLFYTTMVFLLFSFCLSGQTKIEVELEDYDADSLILAYYYADKILVTDTLFANDQRTFVYEQDTLLPSGMYVIVRKPGGAFYQILLNDKDQEFKVKVDPTRQNEIEIEGSEENGVFYDYMRYLNDRRSELDRIEKALATADSNMVSIKDQLTKDSEEIEEEINMLQTKIIESDPDGLTSLLIKSNLPFVFPDFSNEEDVESSKYQYYKEHYFDNIPLDNPLLLRTPILHQRINYYMNNLTPQIPDSLIISIDRILTALEPSHDAFQYYLSYFLNTYGNSKYIGMDAIYVHLALEYYDKGMAPWVNEENLNEIVSNAKKIEPTLIGKQAPDFTIYQEDGTPISLSDFKKDYTVLVFWKPDCGHCTKAMPHILEFYEKYKDQSVDVLAICTKTGEKLNECWESVKEKNMQPLYNAGDEYHRSRIFSKYFVNSTPSIYILDKDKKIKLKKVPAENLDPVMIELFKIDEAEGRIH